MNAPALLRQQLLLVDDEEDALMELAELLEGEGFCCFTATSVKLALQHLTRHPDIGSAHARGKRHVTDQAFARTHLASAFAGDRHVGACGHGRRQRHAALASARLVSQADLSRSVAGDAG